MRLRNIPGARDMIAASPWVVKKPEDHCGQWKSFFGDDHPLHLEIGTGKGRFIMQLAQEHPEINYIGIEKYSSVLLRCLEKTGGTAAEKPDFYPRRRRADQHIFFRRRN